MYCKFLLHYTIVVVGQKILIKIVNSNWAFQCARHSFKTILHRCLIHQEIEAQRNWVIFPREVWVYVPCVHALYSSCAKLPGYFGHQIYPASSALQNMPQPRSTAWSSSSLERSLHVLTPQKHPEIPSYQTPDPALSDFQLMILQNWLSHVLNSP